jgi:hypothetical protein
MLKEVAKRVDTEIETINPSLSLVTNWSEIRLKL